MDMESYHPPRSTPVGNGAGGAIVSNAFDGWSKRGRKIVHDVYLQRIQYYSTTYGHYCASHAAYVLYIQHVSPRSVSSLLMNCGEIRAL